VTFINLMGTNINSHSLFLDWFSGIYSRIIIKEWGLYVDEKV